MNGCAHRVGWLYMTLNYFTYLRGLLRLGAKMRQISQITKTMHLIAGIAGMLERPTPCSISSCGKRTIRKSCYSTPDMSKSPLQHEIRCAGWYCNCELLVPMDRNTIPWSNRKTMKCEHVSESNPRKDLSLSTPIPARKRFFRWWWGWLVVSGGLWRFVFFPVSLLCPRLGGFRLVVFCLRAICPTFLSLVGGLSGHAKRLGLAVFRRWNRHFEEMIQFEPVWFSTRNFQCFGFSFGGCESCFSHVTSLPPVWSSPMCPMVCPAAISEVRASTQGFEVTVRSKPNNHMWSTQLSWYVCGCSKD